MGKISEFFKQFGIRELVIALAIGAFAIGIAVYKATVLGYQVVDIQPESGYMVDLQIEVEAAGRDVRVSTFLPVQSERQRIRRENQEAPSFTYEVTPEREAIWSAADLSGKQLIRYSCFAQTEARTYELPAGRLVAPALTPELLAYIEPSDDIQSEEDDIVAKAWELMPDGVSVEEGLRAVFDYVHQEIDYREVRGATDALTAFRLEQASCNGKNRLLISLCRARAIPARMVKGLILENTSKRTTHAWSELFIGGQWVPFCPTNGYFAQIPEQYLELARVDRALFLRSSSIGFDWEFTVTPQVQKFEDAVRANANNPLNFLNYWVNLEQSSVSIRLIMVILLIPIAATVVSFARTVVGLHTFGTFMPSLIAVSFLLTGYWTGSLFFMLIMIFTGLMNLLLVRLRMLHLPRLVIILTGVVMMIMLVSVIATRMGIPGAAGISLFPVAILSLTSERFSQTILEDGWREALNRTCVTYLVSAACYGVIAHENLQLLVAAFPELLLVNIALNMVIGSWHGIRMAEYLRFRVLLQKAGS